MAEFGTNPDDLETWQNISKSRFVLKKMGARGDLIDEMIGGQRKFHLTTRERHVNQELSADATLDPFRNGMFSPVKLLETTEDAEEIASLPNLIGEEEMGKLVRGTGKTLQSRLETIDNPIVLDRMLEVAKEADVAASKITLLEDRIEEIAPSAFVNIESK